MRPLEHMAGPCAHPEDLKRLGVQYILVLGGGGPADWRVVEGIRLFRHLPNTRLILSGGREDQVESISAFPVEMGVPKQALIIETKAFDTADEARVFGEIVGKTPFALVTSAYHIPRAMKLFRSSRLESSCCPLRIPCEKASSAADLFAAECGCIVDDTARHT